MTRKSKSTPAFLSPTVLASTSPRIRVASPLRSPRATATPTNTSAPQSSSPESIPSAQSQPLLVRAARGQPVPRPPIWLMRQAGRYMAAFRAYSDAQPFRQRSETAATAIELSLQPYRAFSVDAIIMFSDILTPLPALGVEFDMAPGIGPVLPLKIRSDAAVFELLRRHPLDQFDPAGALPFVGEILSTLRSVHLAHDSQTALMGFVGAPFTLAAYIIEGRSSKLAANVKRFMFADDSESATPAGLHALLAHLADAIAQYAIFQLDAGAHAVQLFESWAHHLSPQQYAVFGAPYSARVARIVRAARPQHPIFYFANGSAGKLAVLREHLADITDVIALDWSTSLQQARGILGEDVVLQGNADPAVLAYGSEAAIRAAARDCVTQGGERLIVNVGHGVIKETPETAVGVFVDEIRRMA